MADRIELSAADHQRMLAAVAEAGGVDKLLAKVRTRNARTKLEPRTAAEVVALKEAGIITRAEARGYLQLRNRPTRSRV